MYILGIDPGLACTGWAILNNDNNSTPLLKDWGRIITPKICTLSQKLAFLYKELFKIMTDHSPDKMVIEKVFVHKNPSSALTLGYARGIAMMTAALKDIPVTEQSATTAKLRLTGHGHASKEQVMAMVKSIFKVNMPSDCADAVALSFSCC